MIYSLNLLIWLRLVIYIKFSVLPHQLSILLSLTKVNSCFTAINIICIILFCFLSLLLITIVLCVNYCSFMFMLPPFSVPVILDPACLCRQSMIVCSSFLALRIQWRSSKCDCSYLISYFKSVLNALLICMLFLLDASIFV